MWYIANVSTHTYTHTHILAYALSDCCPGTLLLRQEQVQVQKKGPPREGEEGGPFATRQPRNCKDKNGRWTRSVSYSAGQLWKKIMITGTHIILWLPNNLKSSKVTLSYCTRLL